MTLSMTASPPSKLHPAPAAAPPQTDDMDFLLQVSRLLAQADREGVLEQVIRALSDYLGAERASLLLHPEHTKDWTPVFYRYMVGGPEADALPNTTDMLHFARRVIDKGLAGWVVRHQQGAIVEDTHDDSRWYRFPDGASNARSALSVPFIYDHKVLGVVTLLHPEIGHFTEQHLRLATVVANQATASVRNAQLVVQMEAQQRQLEGMLRAMPDLLMILDEGGRVLMTNTQAGDWLREGDAGSTDSTGNTDDTLTGRSFADLVGSNEVMAQIQDTLANAAAEEQAWSFEARDEGNRRDFLVNVARWDNPIGEQGYVVVLRDISQLRDLNRFKDEMLAMASHDLRAPLALIVGYCSLIELDAPPDSTIPEYLQIILRAAQKMTGLLDELLRVERIRKSAMEMNEQADFGVLVEEAVQSQEAAAAAKRQMLSIGRLALEDVPGVLINPLWMREAMENLISNAIKYTPEGGRVLVSAFREGERLHYEVEDNGIGIPKDLIPKLFMYFSRLKQAGTENVEGKGFGLSFVKTVAERHQGQVYVESEAGKGSRFGFWIPLNAA